MMAFLLHWVSASRKKKIQLLSRAFKTFQNFLLTSFSTFCTCILALLLQLLFVKTSCSHLLPGSSLLLSPIPPPSYLTKESCPSSKTVLKIIFSTEPCQILGVGSNLSFCLYSQTTWTFLRELPTGFCLFISHSPMPSSKEIVNAFGARTVSQSS